MKIKLFEKTKKSLKLSVSNGQNVYLSPDPVVKLSEKKQLNFFSLSLH